MVESGQEVSVIAEPLRPLAVDISMVRTLEKNPRRGEVKAIMRSLDKFGQRKAIVAKRDGEVIAGNHTLMAARELGWTEIAVVFTDDDSQTAKAFALADNRTGDLGTYDDEILAELLVEVSDDPELLLATGYTPEDVDALLASVDIEDTTTDGTDDTEAPTSAPAKTIRGDIWRLGSHRLMCGDCREPSDVDKLLGGAQINLAFTSPPYAEQRTYDESSGFKPIPPDEYVEWFQMVQANVAANLAEDGSWFVNIKPASRGLDTELYVMDLVLAHARDWGWHFASEYCWERVGIPGEVVRRFKSQWEPIFQFTKRDWKFRPEEVRHWSTSATNLTGSQPNAAARQGNMGAVDGAEFGEGMAYPGNRLPTFAGSHEATGHGAAFPVGLPQFFVKAYTDEGDTVYDPFIGSGSTLLAAHKQNRIGYGMEISPAYCDIICARFQKATGIKPINEATGNEHDFLTE
jgi:DNA modification methylase